MSGAGLAPPHRGQDEAAGGNLAYRRDGPEVRAGAVDIAGPDNGAGHLAGSVGLEHELLARHLCIHVRDAVRPHGMAFVNVRRNVESEGDDRREMNEALRAPGGGSIERMTGPE